MTTYTVRLVVEDAAGHAWTAAAVTVIGIIDAARWRDTTRAWCATNPLPDGYSYFIPLPRQGGATLARPNRRRRRRTS